MIEGAKPAITCRLARLSNFNSWQPVTLSDDRYSASKLILSLRYYGQKEMIKTFNVSM